MRGRYIGQVVGHGIPRPDRGVIRRTLSDRLMTQAVREKTANLLRAAQIIDCSERKPGFRRDAGNLSGQRYRVVFNRYFEAALFDCHGIMLIQLPGVGMQNPRCLYSVRLY